MTRATLVVMVKLPRPGQVKTRLGRDLGPVPAAWWFRHQVSALLRRLRDPRWGVLLAVAPDWAARSPVWPADLARLPQGTGSLGDRMARAMGARGPVRHPGSVAVIGADIPGIRRRHIAAAFSALGSADAVIGPAPDGGYWLLGLRHPARAPRGFLLGVRWSTAHARSDTRATLHPRRIAETATLRDVDTLADLRALRSGGRPRRGA